MIGKIYEMVKIERHSEKLEADTLRIGKRYIPAAIQEGASAVLLHEDNPDKALVTSSVEGVDIQGNESTIVFTTKHTTYTIREVAE